MKNKHKIKIIVALIPVLGTLIATILTLIFTNNSEKTNQTIETNITGGNTVYNTVNNSFNNATDNADNSSESKESTLANDIIKSLYLGMNKNYVDELIGIPKYELVDEDLVNAFYELSADKVIIRCIFEENNLLVGYMATVNDINKGINFPDPIRRNEVFEYGNVTIESVGCEGIYDTVEANFSTELAYSYYWEYYYLSNVGDSNGLIVAISPYGFWEDDTWYLMELVRCKEMGEEYLLGEDIDIDEKISEYQKKLHPNTFGIINPDYRDRINPYIDNIDMMTYWKACVNDFTELLGPPD